MNKGRNKTIDFYSFIIQKGFTGMYIKKIIIFQSILWNIILLILNCWLAKTKSKEGRVSNLFGKENANDYIRKNERIHYIDNDDY